MRKRRSAPWTCKLLAALGLGFVTVPGCQSVPGRDNERSNPNVSSSPDKEIAGYRAISSKQTKSKALDAAPNQGSTRSPPAEDVPADKGIVQAGHAQVSGK